MKNSQKYVGKSTLSINIHETKSVGKLIHDSSYFNFKFFIII